ncbi:hypothetical protein MMC22_010006 [Lobaria immixta]|nr:hypothetical protein [Lobaria immixta]
MLEVHPRLVTNDPDLEKIFEPSVRSAIGVIWEATSPPRSAWDLDCIRRNLRSSLVGDETIFEDQFLSCVIQRRQQGLWIGLLEAQAIDELVSYFLLPEIWPWIKAYGAALRGRYRWSVSFVEELFKVYVCEQGLNELSIPRASDAVQKRVKTPLIQRIEKLATGDLQSQKLANDVFQMAVQAMLFDRSRILDTAQAEILIEQAIGFVRGKEQGKLKVRLAEWPVVEAVLDYHQRVNRSLIDQSLGSWQYRPSSFGFITEDRLAEAIYANAAPEQEETKRRDFLRKFDSVNRISTQGIGAESLLNLEEFVLELNPGPGRSPPNKVGNVAMWFNQVLTGTPRPIFLLPSESAGPDVMFVLRKQDNTQVKRLVCGVQNTLDPDQWYGGSSKLNERAQFLESLHWFKHQSANQSNEKIEFLSILLLARQNNVNGHKILEGLAGRKRPGFAMDIIWNAEDRKDKLISSLQNPKIKTKPTVQDIDQAENDSRYAIEVANGISSTDYYLKILTFESVEDIFGPVFFRLLRGTQEDP